MKDGANVMNLDEYKDLGTHWIPLYLLNNELIFLYSFGVENIPKIIQKIIGNKNIKINIFRIRANNLIKL